MKQISETSEHIIFLGYFQGKQVRIFKSKATGEVFFNMDDIAKVLGYSGEDEMMADPEVKETLKQEHTGKAVTIKTENRNNIN